MGRMGVFVREKTVPATQRISTVAARGVILSTRHVATSPTEGSDAWRSPAETETTGRDPLAPAAITAQPLIAAWM